MLEVAAARGEPQVLWKQGGAEDIPLEDGTVGLVFMSQVFHHLNDPRRALDEIRRVLTPSGYLAVRNGVREQNAELAWLKCFPEAAEIEERRTPSRKELEETVAGAHSFDLVARRTVRQLFASSYEEYFEKISRRGLSALIVIRRAFRSGLERLRNSSTRSRATPRLRPVELFVFRSEPPEVFPS